MHLALTRVRCASARPFLPQQLSLGRAIARSAAQKVLPKFLFNLAKPWTAKVIVASRREGERPHNRVSQTPRLRSRRGPVPSREKVEPACMQDEKKREERLDPVLYVTINACACADIYENQEPFAKRTSVTRAGRVLPISGSLIPRSLATRESYLLLKYHPVIPSNKTGLLLMYICLFSASMNLDAYSDCSILSQLKRKLRFF